MAKELKKKIKILRLEPVIMKLIEAINGNRETAEKNLQGIKILRERVDKMVSMLEIPPIPLMTDKERKKQEETPSYIG